MQKRKHQPIEKTVNMQLNCLIGVGSEQTVQEIIHGKRELTVPQIRLLAERFHVSPAVFI